MATTRARCLGCHDVESKQFKAPEPQTRECVNDGLAILLRAKSKCINVEVVDDVVLFLFSPFACHSRCFGDRPNVFALPQNSITQVPTMLPVLL